MGSRRSNPSVKLVQKNPIDSNTIRSSSLRDYTPSPNVTLSASRVTLSDSATLSGGSNPTGTITFTLTAPGGTTVDTETVAVNGNKTYATPVGFTLPTAGTVAGTYSWNATYSGDPSNNGATASPEQTLVSPSSPSLQSLSENIRRDYKVFGA